MDEYIFLELQNRARNGLIHNTDHKLMDLMENRSLSNLCVDYIYIVHCI